MPVLIRILGVALNTIGALLLAWRVKSILDALVTAQTANDLNFRLLIRMLEGREQVAPLVVGMNDQVENQQKRGIWLLVAGFIAIAAGNVLVGWSLYLDS
ncbi:hypothetical protein T5B8_07528 [Salinisphaera sp. T5B8]|uniref:hypothetical protein n=1 Tax=Salinisphaera sp. T5B8 TaxID=1304154 RepID=UPI00333F01D3